MTMTRYRTDVGAHGSQLLGFDDSFGAVRMARQELAERAWRSEIDAAAPDARKTEEAHAVSVWERPIDR